MSSTNNSLREKVVAFFHPHCSAGGGGERVLWKAVEALGDMRDDAGLPISVVIYTIDTPHENYKEDILQHVKSRFLIDISQNLPILFVHLNTESHFLDTPRRLTLIMESIGTMRLAWAAIRKVTPDIYIDTTGCAFTYPIVRIFGGCRVAAYVHYPTISRDMLALVWERRRTYNNDVQVATSSLTTYMKLVYYTVFAFLYGAVGSMANLVMVNSSWTYSHISFLWRFAFSRIHVVFPPCDTKSLEYLSLSNRENIVVSIGQFRPEKDHALQIESFAHLLAKYSDIQNIMAVKLVLIGSCRGEEDESRVQQLRELSDRLGIASRVEFVINQPYPVLKEWFGRASVGLHTMWNEHFGIGVVEMMAAGIIVVAHNSGGPKADILTPLNGEKTGFLASTAEEYCEAMFIALCNGPDHEANMRIRFLARESAKRFSDEVFETSFKRTIISSNILR
eukprot:CAMPEP_0198297260 /NCGR_PEP_ID=MMETSP1449-20131203/36260_1 /TAXON_ID=420275 /ORGANISM="Attheya septentrionalis, Strain CCMP2084" /LENGTH=449 /DNA_ID=CAMNT_0043998143 /DNA_START=201 /DNA_END=1550 /DNA_ORIENTATION=-